MKPTLSVILTALTLNCYCTHSFATGGGGDIVGNGGFAFTASNKILDIAIKELQDELLKLNPVLAAISPPRSFYDIPSTIRGPEKPTVTEARLIRIIKNTHRIEKDQQIEPAKMFTYDPKTDTITALYHYFVATAFIQIQPVNEIQKQILRDAIDSTKIKLVHEALHLFGYDETESEEIAVQLVQLCNARRVWTIESAMNPKYEPAYDTQPVLTHRSNQLGALTTSTLIHNQAVIKDGILYHWQFQGAAYRPISRPIEAPIKDDVLKRDLWELPDPITLPGQKPATDALAIAWIDTATHLIWIFDGSQAAEDEMSDRACNWLQEANGPIGPWSARIPTASEFHSAIKHGLRELFPTPFRAGHHDVSIQVTREGDHINWDEEFSQSNGPWIDVGYWVDMGQGPYGVISGANDVHADIPARTRGVACVVDLSINGGPIGFDEY